MTEWICRKVKCKFSGRDKYDGYPVCKHKDAHLKCDREIHDPCEGDFEDEVYPPQVSMEVCPLNLWRISGDRRIPVSQSLLVEYQT